MPTTLNILSVYRVLFTREVFPKEIANSLAFKMTSLPTLSWTPLNPILFSICFFHGSHLLLLA